MKKILLLIAVVSFTGFSASAQSTSFGLKAGMTASNMKFSGEGMSLTLDTKIGFYAGLIADIGISENFAVQPELNYELLGSKSSDDGEFGTGKLDLSYLTLPVLVKYKNQGFSAFLGPQIGYLISAKSKGEGESEDVKDSFKSTDLSGVVGAGYTLANGFGFDARYQLGLGDIGGDDFEGVKIKNNSFLVGVHYFFNRLF